MNTGTWTEEQMTMLLSMIGAATASKIGRAIGKTRNAVLGKIHRLGLHSDAQKSRKHYKTWTADKEAMLRQLHAARVTYASIAVTIGDGMTEKAVSAKCKRLRLDSRPLYNPLRKQPVSRTRGASVLANLPPMLRSTAPVGPTFYPDRPPPQPLAIRHTVLTLTSKTCRWPIGDPGTKDFYFCGHTPRDNSVYCPFHHAVAFQPPVERPGVAA